MFKIPPVNINSLFVKSMFSFLTIILLLASFNFMSFAFFKTNIQNEIIQHNRKNLKNTADRYEKHLAMIRNLLFKLHQDENVVAFGRQLTDKETASVQYLKTADIIKSIRSDINNPFLYLDNIAVLYPAASFIVDKGGTGDAARYFSRFYISEMYGIDYWRKQFSKPYTSELHPGRLFTIVSSDKQSKQFIPFTVKLPSYPHLIIGMLDAKPLYESFHGTDDSGFLIMHENGSVLFHSGEPSVADKPTLSGNGQDTVFINDNYYFYHTSSETKLTYVTTVPYSSIAAQIKKLEWTLLVLSVLSFGIAAAASVVFSRRINTPVKQLIASLRQRNPEAVSSSIHEFALINEMSRELIQERNEFHHDLLAKTSQLTDFGYINKLKMITSASNDSIAHNRPFRIVLFHLHFRSTSLQANHLRPEQLTYTVRECIDLLISQSSDSSRTLQMENNQLLSVIWGETEQQQLEDTLNGLKTIFDKEKEHYVVTVAVSSCFPAGADLNRAYMQVLDRAKQSKLWDETQLIWEDAPAANHFALTAEQEQELYVNMQEGNGPACLHIIARMLDFMYKKNAFRIQYRAFAHSVSVKIINISEKMKVDAKQQKLLNDMLEQLDECFTLEGYQRFFERFVSSAASSIQMKRDEKDPVVEFFARYLESHYSEDISLDSVADRMNMSSNYLSAYIKEKTGTNFSDHLNNVRIRQAKEMLQQSALSIQEIGEKIGYRNVTSFIRMFKKITGLTPGDYRKRAALEGKAEWQT